MLRHYEREKIIWDSGFDSTETFLLLALNTFIDGNGDCWPSIDALIEMTRLSRSSIVRAINRLAGIGAVKSSPRFDEKTGRQRSNLYQIDFPGISKGGCQSDRGEGVNLTGGGCQSDRGEGVNLTGGGCQIDTQTYSKRTYSERTDPERTDPERTDPERAQTQAGDRVIPNPDPEPTQQTIDLEPGTKILSLSQVTNDREDKCSASPAQNRVWDAKLGIPHPTSSDPDYVRFKRSWEGLCRVVGARYGNHEEAAIAWAECQDLGLITTEFWRGLEVSIDTFKNQFKKEGKAIGVKGAPRYLREREWVDALARAEIQAQAQAAGVDLSDPESVKKAQFEADRAAQKAELMALLEQKYGAQNA